MARLLRQLLQRGARQRAARPQLAGDPPAGGTSAHSAWGSFAIAPQRAAKRNRPVGPPVKDAGLRLRTNWVKFVRAHQCIRRRSTRACARLSSTSELAGLRITSLKRPPNHGTIAFTWLRFTKRDLWARKKISGSSRSSRSLSVKLVM